MIKNLTKLRWFYTIVLTLIFLMSGVLIFKNVCWNCDHKKDLSNNLFFKWNNNNLIDQIKKIHINFNGEKFTLVADKDDKWLVVEKGNYPALSSKVKELIFGLADLKIIEAKTSRPENFASLHLEDIEINKNVTKITLIDENNKEIDSVYIGNREFIASSNATEYSAYIFVRRSAEHQTWLVAGRLAEGFAFRDFVKQPILGLDLATILEITLSKPKQPKNVIKIERNSITGESKLLDIPPKYQVKDQYIIDNIVQQFAYLNYDDVVQDSFDAVKVLEGQIIVSSAVNNQPDKLHDTAKHIFELVYLNNNYYFKINDPQKIQENIWLYKISDYACQSLLVNKKDLLTEIKHN